MADGIVLSVFNFMELLACLTL